MIFQGRENWRLRHNMPKARGPRSKNSNGKMSQGLSRNRSGLAGPLTGAGVLPASGGSTGTMPTSSAAVSAATASDAPQWRQYLSVASRTAEHRGQVRWGSTKLFIAYGGFLGARAPRC
jgi:hypothetical protein